MPGLEIIAAFFAASLLLALSPGPDILFVLTQAALFGAKAGIITTLGLISGLWVHTLAVALGVAVVFQTSRVAFNLLKYFGAAYLCWLAWLSFRASATLAKTGTHASFIGYKALYRRGVIMNISNPKVALFFLAFLPQFCEPAKGYIWAQIIILGMLFMFAAMLVFIGVAFCAGKLASHFIKSPGIQIFLHRAAAFVFLGLACALVFTGQ